MNRSFAMVGLLATLSLGACAVQAADTPPDPGALKSIMVGLGQDMAQVQAGLWLEDYAVIAAGAQAIADHPHVSSAERSRVMGTLGPDMGAFVKGDKAVHDGALRLVKAAEAKDLDATVKEMVAVQQGCVSCHTQFRARLRR